LLKFFLIPSGKTHTYVDIIREAPKPETALVKETKLKKQVKEVIQKEREVEI
jgi:hypothetical protein